MKNSNFGAAAILRAPRWNTNTLRKLMFGLGVALAGVSGATLVEQPASAQPRISVSLPNRHAHLAAVEPMSGQRPFHTPAFSTYLAGYQVTEPGISRASMSFVVPALTCGADNQGTAEGIGHEQVAGNPTLLAVVFTACVGGSPNFAIEALAGTHTNVGTASTGDTINVVVTQTRTVVTATVNDISTATKVTASGAPTPDNTLTFGSFPLFSGVILPVANFGDMRMQNPTLENTLLRDWMPSQLTRKTGAIVQIRPTAISGSNGGFGLQFVNN